MEKIGGDFMIRPDFREFRNSTELYHYGMPRRSGRYPWGSGNRPYQRDDKNDKVMKSRIKLSKMAKPHLLTSSILDKYKKQYKNLSHVKIDRDTNGILYEKNGNVVAIVNTEKKDDGKIWIQGLEIFGDNKGQGLSRGLLDVAVKDLNATDLSVRKTNLVAKKLYDDYGFRTYSETDYMYFMTVRR